MTIITDQSCTSYHRLGHPERPARVTLTQELLRDQTELPLTWVAPKPADDEAILRAHTPEYIARLRIPRDFDADTSFFPDIESLARNSAGAAILEQASCPVNDATRSGSARGDITTCASKPGASARFRGKQWRRVTPR